MQILFYSPDSYGLGHVRRTVSLADRLLGEFEGSSALVLTGAPRAHYFAYPSRCDYLKLPSVTKDGRGNYVSGELDLSLPRMVELRGRLVLEAARAFGPDVFVVDHSPRGLGGEVLPALEDLGARTPRCLRVLGLRDVIDEPEAVRRAWRREGVLDVLRRGYDRILIYGERELFDPVAAYDIPDDIASKVRFVGYVGRTWPVPPVAPRSSRPTVLVTAGGGGDGKALLRAVIEEYRMLGDHTPFDVVAVTGPLMSPRKRAELSRRAEGLSGLSLLEHVEDLPRAMADSDAVVSMAGYNTVCELASLGARAILVPRVHPRREQWVRARALADRGAATCLDLDEAERPGRLMNAIATALARPRPEPGWGLDLGGLDGVVEALSEFDASRVGGAPRRAEA